MAKMSAKEMSLRAIELYYEGKHDELETILDALRERAPKTHRRTVEHLDSIIHEQADLDSVAEIQLW
ncbi:hypothetical protein [Escherichia phage AV102]|nr:hypothetical protein [Escherichia phage AV102]